MLKNWGYIGLVAFVISSGCAGVDFRKTEITVSDPDLIAYWPMNEGPGTVIRDYSKNANHAKLNGLKWDEEGGVIFSGTKGQHIRVKQLSEYDLSKYGQYTVSACVKPQAVAGRQYTIVRVGASGSRESAVLGIAQNNWLFAARDEDFQPHIKYVGYVSTGAWSHVAVVWDGIALSLYVEGKYVDGISLKSVASDSAGIGIGGEPDSWRENLTFHGTIREVRIYRRVLSKSEIESLIDGPVTK